VFDTYHQLLYFQTLLCIVLTVNGLDDLKVAEHKHKQYKYHPASVLTGHATPVPVETPPALPSAPQPIVIPSHRTIRLQQKALKYQQHQQKKALKQAFIQQGVHAQPIAPVGVEHSVAPPVSYQIPPPVPVHHVTPPTPPRHEAPSKSVTLPRLPAPVYAPARSVPTSETYPSFIEPAIPKY